MRIQTFFAVIFSMVVFLFWSRIEEKFFPNAYHYKEVHWNKKKRSRLSVNHLQNKSHDESKSFENLMDTQIYSQKFDKKKVAPLHINSSKISLSISPLSGVLNSVVLEDKALFDNEQIFAFKDKFYQKWNHVLYDVAEQEKNLLVLEHRTSQNLIIQKIYKVLDLYTFEFKLKLINKGNQHMSFSDGICFDSIKSFGDLTNLKREKKYFKFSILNSKKKPAKHYRKIKNNKVFYDSPLWIAWQDKYFSFILKPEQRIERTYLEVGKLIPAVSFRGSKFSLNPEESYSEKFMVYCGPKNLRELKSVDGDLKKIVSFGFFNKISLVLLFILNFFFSLTGNYGVAIILLTLSVKLLLLPLSHKTLKSMKKLHKLQPHVEGLRKKYKDDPRKLQLEMTSLYRKQKINPLAGCLPIVAQMPFFLALFWLLQSAFELKGAHFLWIDDLSAKDPTFIFPIIMGISMLIQQVTSPSFADNKQKKMIVVIPIVMTFLFLNFPAGLVLYWFFSNVVTIFYQKIIQ